jgi:hypothetical protein
VLLSETHFPDRWIHLARAADGGEILATLDLKICIHSENELKSFGNRPTDIVGGL